MPGLTRHPVRPRKPSLDCGQARNDSYRSIRYRVTTGGVSPM
jgi:hypothetical protein